MQCTDVHTHTQHTNTHTHTYIQVHIQLGNENPYHSLKPARIGYAIPKVLLNTQTQASKGLLIANLTKIENW